MEAGWGCGARTMKGPRARLRGLVLAWVAQAFCGEFQLEVIQRTSIGVLPETGITRASVCSNGMVVVTHNSGELTLVDGQGRVLLHRRVFAELEGAVASGCDDRGNLYISAKDGMVRVYSVSSSGEPALQRSFRIAGGPNRFLLSGHQLYVVGLARAGNKSVFLRRFRVPDGELLGVPTVELSLGRGAQLNQLLLNGSLLRLPDRDEVLYLPANPLEFWSFDASGRALARKRPVGSELQDAELGALLGATPVNWKAFDWVRNGAVLSDGRVLVQIILGNRPGGNRSFLEIFDAELNAVAARVPVSFDFGFLLGADRSGHLYSANLRIGGSSVVKTRLVER